MITVTVYINGVPTYTRTAVRTRELEGTNKREYHLDDGNIITHNPDHGRVALARKMLKGVKAVAG